MRKVLEHFLFPTLGAGLAAAAVGLGGFAIATPWPPSGDLLGLTAVTLGLGCLAALVLFLPLGWAATSFLGNTTLKVANPPLLILIVRSGQGLMRFGSVFPKGGDKQLLFSLVTLALYVGQLVFVLVERRPRGREHVAAA